MSTAILIDGGFFVKRYRSVHPSHDPKQMAKGLHDICKKHISQKDGDSERDLYRIIYYDCPPLIKKAHYPINNKPIDFSKTNEAIFRQTFHTELKKLRKVALRLGHLADHKHWQIAPNKINALSLNCCLIEVSESRNIGVKSGQQTTNPHRGHVLTFDCDEDSTT